MEIPATFLVGLLGWSSCWLLASVIGLWATRSPGFWRSHWFMSGLWCVVNTLIVSYAIVVPPESLDAFRRILLINAGLDVGYIAVGGVLLAIKRPMLRGFGLAICVQGLFLLVFDLVWWELLRPAASV